MANNELHLKVDVDAEEFADELSRVREAAMELEAALNALDGASVTASTEPIDPDGGGETDGE